MSYRRTKKRNKKSTAFNKQVIVYIIAVIVMLFFVLALRCCLKRETEGFTDDDLIFDSTYKICVYNHRNEKKELLSLEEYIFHVVAAEMPASYSIEALKAQAVAARTYAAARLDGAWGDAQKSCASHDCDICTDSSCCQSWKSIADMKKNWGRDYAMYCKKVYEAVVSTQGEILVYDQKPIDAMYHAASGGKTEDSENVYKYKIPYLRSVESPGEKSYSDSVKLKYSEVVDILSSEFGVKLKKSTLEKGFCINERFDSGRVDTVKVGGKNVSGKDIRRAFSLKSTNFTIEYTEKYVIIRTVGYGHGVGLSQAGANAMASTGADYKEILTHYYTDVEIVDIEKIGE